MLSFTLLAPVMDTFLVDYQINWNIDHVYVGKNPADILVCSRRSIKTAAISFNGGYVLL